MKKGSVFAQWLVVAALAAFIGYTIWHPAPQPERTPEQWRAWDGFSILSYAGIARGDGDPRYPSVQRLGEQLTALHAAGYRTVRPDDVTAFLAGRAPLPDKAVLLVFEGGRKEAFIRATPLLQRLGFTAVLAVPTATTTRWGGFYLKRRDIAKAARLPQWQFGSMGHAAQDAIAVTASGETGRFLSQRAWTPHGPETGAAFSRRVAADYATSASILTAAAGRGPALYLYPYGDAGQHAGDAIAAEANRQAVQQHFRLAITGSSDAFNGPASDPWSLNRLRVGGDVDGAQLVRRLAAGLPRRQPLQGVGDPSDWVLSSDSRLADGRLEMTGGATAWLRGSDAWADVEISARIQRHPGSLAALYGRRSGPRSWMRVSLEDGRLQLQESFANGVQTLHRSRIAMTTQTVHELRLRIRNNRAWVSLDGTDAATAIPLSPRTRRGRVGVGATGGSAALTAFSARPLPARLALVNSIGLLPPAERDEVQAVMPAWFAAGEAPALVASRRQDLLAAAPEGIETIPLIRGGARLAPGPAAAFADAVDSAIIESGLRPLLRELAVEGPSEALAEALMERGYHVTHVLNATEARVVTERPWPGDASFLLDDAGPEAERALSDLLRAVPAERLAALEPSPGAAAAGFRSARRLN